MNEPAWCGRVRHNRVIIVAVSLNVLNARCKPSVPDIAVHCAPVDAVVRGCQVIGGDGIR